MTSAGRPDLRISMLGQVTTMLRIGLHMTADFQSAYCKLRRLWLAAVGCVPPQLCQHRFALALLSPMRVSLLPDSTRQSTREAVQ